MDSPPLSSSAPTPARNLTEPIHVPFGRGADIRLPVWFEIETPYRILRRGNTHTDKQLIVSPAQRLVASASAFFSLGLLDEAEQELGLTEDSTLPPNDNWLRAVLKARMQVIRGRWVDAAETIAENWFPILANVNAGGNPPPRRSIIPALILHQAGLFRLEEQILRRFIDWGASGECRLQLACCLSRHGKPAQAFHWILREEAEVLMDAEALVDPDLAPLWSWCESAHLCPRCRARLCQLLSWIREGIGSSLRNGDLDIASFHLMPDELARLFVLRPGPLTYSPAAPRGGETDAAWAYMDARIHQAVARLERLEARLGLSGSKNISATSLSPANL